MKLEQTTIVTNPNTVLLTDMLTVERRFNEIKEIVGLFIMVATAMAYNDNQAEGHQEGFNQLERLAEEAWEHLEALEKAMPKETWFAKAPHAGEGVTCQRHSAV